MRPIRDIAGEEMFCEVFFDDARVPVDYRLGDEGEGWLVAMGTLGRERVGTAGLAIGMRADLDAMINLAQAVNPDALRDPEIRERIARAHTDIEYTKLLNYRALSKILKNEKNWPEVPLAKLQWSHLAQTLAELAVDLLGPAGMMGKGGPDAVDGGCVEPAVRVPALHVDRRRHHRGAEEHHRRQGDQAAPQVSDHLAPRTDRPKPDIVTRSDDRVTGRRRSAVSADAARSAVERPPQPSRSMTVAFAWPPPSHMVWKP